MPVKDRHHDLVKRALIVDGWRIIKEQVLITTGTRRLFIDIQAASRTQPTAALIEVKGFASPVDALAEALGQYLLYKFAIDYAGLDLPLFLAVPLSAYQGILSEPIGVYARQVGKIKLMVFDAVSGRVVEWIN